MFVSKEVLLYFMTEDISSALDYSFIDDIEKIEDMKILTKEEFLESYSYLTNKEYEATALIARIGALIQEYREECESECLN